MRSRSPPKKVVLQARRDPAPPRHRILIQHCPTFLTAQDLYEAFAEQAKAPVKGVEMLAPQPGERGVRAYVEFSTADDAAAAQKRFDGGCLNGEVIKVVIVPIDG